MRKRMILCAALFLVTAVFVGQPATAQNFEAKKVTDNIFLVRGTEGGEGQIVITSDSGLVVLNSFWSEVVAKKFRTAIANQLKRDDFYRVINMVDRLDMFGGNAAYTDIPILAHRAFLDRYKDHEDDVAAEIERLIEMWRWKAQVARDRLPTHEPGSQQAINEQRWINTCTQRADELEQGFSLVLPTEIYDDRKNLPLGDITLDLIWLGKAGNDGMSIIRIPELSVAIIPGFIMHPHHLAPYPQSAYTELDVPRWIAVMEELFEGEDAVDSVRIENTEGMWSRERAHTHLNYIRTLWNGIEKAEAEGKSLNEVHEQFSMENECAFVKEMQVYIDNGDEWIREQHHTHIRLFYLQHKNPASELIKRMGADSLSVALEQIRKSWSEGGDLYIEEASLNTIGYHLLSQEKFVEAIEVFHLNVDVFPESANVYDSYAEALMKSGDVENAIVNYNKSLELNPDNGNAREMLRTLEGQ